MTTLEYIVNKYGLDLEQKRQPIEIPDTTRNTFATLTHELGFTKGVEVGVEKGIYSEILLQSNPELHLTSIDAWTAYTGYRDHVTQEECDGLLDETRKRLSPYGERSTIMKEFSAFAHKQFEDNSLDFVYIDGNHEFQHVVNDIALWSKKVKVGGIIAGHDYIKRKGGEYNMHVIPAIHGYIDAYGIRPLFVFGRKDASTNLNPEKGELRESTRSFMFVKPEPREVVPGHNQSA